MEEKMIENLLKEENCVIRESVKDWKEAVHVSLERLIEQGYCTEAYEQAVFDSTAEYGPYYVLTDNMAMVHATNKIGVNETQMAVTVLREPVRFEEDGADVRILIALCAVDANAHIDGMATVLTLFGDDDKSEDVLAAQTGKEVYDIFMQYAD